MKTVLFAILGVTSLAVISVPPAYSQEVPEVKDFSSLSEQAKSKQLPILLMFAAVTCEYCERLEEEQLGPMLISGNFKDKVFIRKHVLDKVGYIKNFQGQAVSYSDFADEYNVDLTPTILFLDSNGKKLHKNIYGYNGSDFFGEQLESAIASSQKIIYQRNSQSTLTQLNLEQR